MPREMLLHELPGNTHDRSRLAQSSSIDQRLHKQRFDCICILVMDESEAFGKSLVAFVSNYLSLAICRACVPLLQLSQKQINERENESLLFV